MRRRRCRWHVVADQVVNSGIQHSTINPVVVDSAAKRPEVD